ncbi:MAG: hypothetical protein ABSB58_03385 [Gemmatimonadales bacterium]|jgi:hypothetical protein
MRPLPWTDLIEAIGTKRFEDIREAVSVGRVDAANRDAFILAGPAGALLKELMPEEAPAQAVMEYGALLHQLYLHWDAGHPLRRLDRAALEAALTDFRPLGRPPAAPDICYVQLPERAVWAEPNPGEPHEPLDGCFVQLSASAVTVLAILGFRPERGGFTTVEASAPLPAKAPGPRPDGSTPFANVLPAGERMGFRSLVSPGELVALALLCMAATAP